MVTRHGGHKPRATRSLSGLAQLLRHHALTLRGLAGRLGVSHSLLSQIAHGRRTLVPELLERMAAELAITPAEVLSALGAPPIAPVRARDNLEAIRALHLADSSVRVASIEVLAEVDRHGNLALERRYLGCVPANGREQAEIVLKTRNLGHDAPKQEPSIALSPGAASVALDSVVDEPWRVHRVRFSRTEGGVAIRFCDRVDLAYHPHSLDPVALAWSKWACYAQYLPLLADRLSISISLAEEPVCWELRYWLGGGPMTEAARPAGDAGPCSRWAIERGRREAHATIERPVLGYSYAVSWLPKEAK